MRPYVLKKILIRHQSGHTSELEVIDSRILRYEDFQLAHIIRQSLKTLSDPVRSLSFTKQFI